MRNRISLSYSSQVQSVGDREKQLRIVFRREIAEIRSFEAKCKRSVEACKTTIFSGVSMTDETTNLYSSLAQSVERMTVNHDVAGSSPAGGAKQKQTAFAVCFCFTSC